MIISMTVERKTEKTSIYGWNSKLSVQQNESSIHASAPKQDSGESFKRSQNCEK